MSQIDPRPPAADGERDLPEEIERAIEAFQVSTKGLAKGYGNPGHVRKLRSALAAAILFRLGEAEAGREEASRWQPIETAPKAWRDETGRGRYVWLVARYPGSPSWTDQYFSWRDSDGAWVRWPHYFPPTHWMDAPKPPALTEAQPKGDQ